MPTWPAWSGSRRASPRRCPAYTVNRLCGTGVQAIVSAAQAIQTGEAQVALAGGAESMSRGPYWMPGARWGARMGETELVDPGDGRAHRSLRVDPDGRDRREPGRARLDLPGAPGRVRGPLPPPGGGRARRRAASTPRSSRCRSRVKRETVAFERDEHIREDASPEVDGRAQAGVQAGRDGHRRQRLAG